MPSVTAATAGGNTAAATPNIAWKTAIGQNEGRSGMASAASVTTTAAATTTARFARVRSIKAPAGVRAGMPATPPTAITAPIDASSHFWTVNR